MYAQYAQFQQAQVNNNLVEYGRQNLRPQKIFHRPSDRQKRPIEAPCRGLIRYGGLGANGHQSVFSILELKPHPYIRYS